MHTVKETALLLDMSEHTVRFYTDKGLVPNLKRDKNNNRQFDEESINWLTGIKYLKQSGMPLDKIKRYIDLCLEGDSTIPQRYAIILEQKEAALAQLEQARERAEYMIRKAEGYREIHEHRLSDIANPATWSAETNTNTESERLEQLQATRSNLRFSDLDDSDVSIPSKTIL